MFIPRFNRRGSQICGRSCGEINKRRRKISVEGSIRNGIEREGEE